MLIRERTGADTAGCLELLRRVHQQDGYPLQLTPEEVPEFFASDHETVAWVAERDARVVGHIALHRPPTDPTITAAEQATGLRSLVLVARLFVAPELRRAGLGRILLRHAVRHAESIGQRAVLDVGMPLLTAVALYEAEGWHRIGELHLPLDDDTILDLWVYLSPEPPVSE